MSNHDFTLHLPDLADLPDGIEDSLYEAGCDDATLSLCEGRVSLTFARESATRAQAIESAIADVAQAGYLAVVEPLSGGEEEPE